MVPHEALHERPRPVQHEPGPRRPTAAPATLRLGRLSRRLPLPLLALVTLETLLTLLTPLTFRPVCAACRRAAPHRRRRCRRRRRLRLQQQPHRLAVHPQACAANEPREKEREAGREGGEQCRLREAWRAAKHLLHQLLARLVAHERRPARAATAAAAAAAAAAASRCARRGPDERVAYGGRHLGVHLREQLERSGAPRGRERLQQQRGRLRRGAQPRVRHQQLVELRRGRL